jgi:hypothetical protein
MKLFGVCSFRQAIAAVGVSAPLMLSIAAGHAHAQSGPFAGFDESKAKSGVSPSIW